MADEPTDDPGPDQPEDEKPARDAEVASLEEKRRGRNVRDREEDGEGAEEEDGQQALFVWEQGRKISLGNLIERGTAVEYAFVFGGKRLKGNGQLIGMNEDVFMVSRGKMGHTKLVPTRDDEEKVTKVTVEVQIVPKLLQNADTDEAMELLRPILEKRGWTKTLEVAEG
jgi:hypothetical protein